MKRLKTISFTSPKVLHFDNIVDPYYEMRPMTWSTVCFVTSLYLSYMFQAATDAKPLFLVADLMRKVNNGMRLALDFMARNSLAIPGPFGEGGGCYTSFGTSLRLQDCRVALASMRSENISPDDVHNTDASPKIMRAFERSNPLV